ncbi:MAG: MoaD/ThiS family protein [Candidatus Heimdallarchaeota archaeon]|nr:MoaD/ThiS family protein [Candidatus Heimdallarchaeota archaeon]
MVEIVFSSVLKQATNGETRRHLQFQGTVKQLLDRLTIIYGDTFKSKVLENNRIKRYINVYCNGVDIRYLDFLDTQIKESDSIDFIPAVAGG